MKTYSFDNLDDDSIRTMAGEMLLENNVEQLRALYEQAGEQSNAANNWNMKTVVHDVLLEKDEYLDIATQVLDGEQIESWVDYHIELVVKQCPGLFGRYAQPDARYMAWLGHHYTNLDEASKVAIFQGKSSCPAHVFMHQVLKNDPTLWDSLTPIWFGANRSLLRQAATDLGWKPNTTTGFFAKPMKARNVNEWGAVLAYPHSTAVVVGTLLQTDLRMTRQRLTNLMGQAGWKGVEPSELPLTQANPRDTTLAALLIERTQYPYVLGEFAPKKELAPEDMAFLRSLVDVHVGVGCLDLLLEALEQDRLPGDMLGIQEAIGLPVDMYALPNLT